jgi:hypothetical protein
VSTEIEPYLVYRFVGESVELAMWRMSEGDRALAVFQTPEAAHAYRSAVPLGDDWMVFHPKRETLLQLLRATYDAGVKYAVLDPDRETAKTVFDLSAVLQAAQSADSH